MVDLFSFHVQRLQSIMVGECGREELLTYGSQEVGRQQEVGEEKEGGQLSRLASSPNPFSFTPSRPQSMTWCCSYAGERGS